MMRLVRLCTPSRGKLLGALSLGWLLAGCQSGAEPRGTFRDPCQGTFSRSIADQNLTDGPGFVRVLRRYNAAAETWYYLGTDAGVHYFLMVDFGSPLTLVDPRTGQRQQTYQPLTLSIGVEAASLPVQKPFTLTKDCSAWKEFQTLEDLGIRPLPNGRRTR